MYLKYRILQYWYFQYCEYYNTGNTSIVNITILVIPVSRPAASYYPLELLSILDVPVSYIYNTGIPESLIYAQYRKLQYSSSNNTGNTSIVKHTILETLVFFIQQYW
jgi:hypothetical protein